MITNKLDPNIDDGEKVKKKNIVDAMEGASAGASTGASGSQGTSQTTDVYQALKDESYKALLNSEIQAGIARDRALKYTQGQLNAQGYGTQGVAESSKIGLYNDYMGALASAKSDYNDSMLKIKENEAQAENDSFESMTTLLGQVSSTDQLNKVLSIYGITNNDGVLSGGSYDKLSPESQKQLSTLVSLAQANLDENENTIDVGSSGIGGEVDMNKIINKNGQTTSRLADESKTMDKYLSNGQLKNGDLIKLENAKGNQETFVIINNGKPYYITEREFNLSDHNKYLIKDTNDPVKYYSETDVGRNASTIIKQTMGEEAYNKFVEKNPQILEALEKAAEEANKKTKNR